MPHRDPITLALSAIDPHDAPALALLGHDLRATVSEVIGGLRLIDLGALPSEPRHQIVRTRAAAEAMALLLEQALMLLLADSAPPHSQKSGLKTTQLIESIDLRWKTLAQQHGLGFHLIADTTLPEDLAVDAVLMERMLSNLLGNAIKYAGKGAITCSLDLTPGQQLRICVQDQGPGFATADPLSANLGPTNKKSGSGLGLQMVKDLVTQAGGQITAQNRAMGGAEVTVLLPLAIPDPASENASTALPNLHGLRILVTDDSETSRLILRSLLASMGAIITTAPDGAQAVGLIENQTFDALLIDVEMPRVNGLKVIEHIRKLPPPIASLPILAVTAYQMRANKQAIMAAGADEILSKPLAGPAILGETILQMMHSKTQKHSHRDLGFRTQIDPSTFENLLKMAGPAVAKELTARLLADLQAAERAILAASHAPNWAALRSQTHILIGLAGTAGAPMLHHLAQAINDLAHQPAPDINTLRTLLPQALESLDMLIHFIGQKSPQPEASA
jgi:two-component system aerobic respiration control sensor histidine kinase ArcB